MLRPLPVIPYRKDHEEYIILKITAAAAALLLIIFIFLPVPQEDVLDFSFSEPVLSHDGVYRTEPARYSALRNEYISIQVRFTDDFDMILYTDGTAGESVFAASKDADRDLTAVIEYLSR